MNSIAMFWWLLKAKISTGSEEEQITKHVQKCYPLTAPRKEKWRKNKSHLPKGEFHMSTLYLQCKCISGFGKDYKLDETGWLTDEKFCTEMHHVHFVVYRHRQPNLKLWMMIMLWNSSLIKNLRFLIINKNIYNRL